MTAQALLNGMAIFALYLAPVALCGRALARHWFSSQPRDVQVLIGSVFAFTLLTVPAELIGTVGGFKRYPLLLVYLVIGAIGAVLTIRAPKPIAGDSPPKQRRAIILEVAAAVALAVTAGAWYVATHDGYAHGTLGFDSLAYHLPFAATFFKTGHTGAVPYIQWFLPNNLFPASSELVNGLGMAATNHDVLSPFISLLWLGQVLLAAGVAFRDRNQRLLSLIAACVVVLMPAFYTSEAGTALADLASAAFVFTGFALFRRMPASRGSMLVVGLAMGLGISCKLTAVVPAAILIAAVLLTPSTRSRLTVTGTFVVGAFIGTGFWLIRDWVDLGNPLPELNLHIFPKTPNLFREPLFAHPKVSQYQPRSLAHYLIRDSNLATLKSAMEAGFGPLWWELFVVVGVIVIAGIFLLRGADRVIAIVALLSAVGYLATPESAPSVMDKPEVFALVIETKILLPVMLAAGLSLTALVASRSRLLPSLVAMVLLAFGGVDLTNAGDFQAGDIQNWVFSTSGYTLLSIGFFVILLILATTKFLSRLQSVHIRLATAAGVMIVAAIVLLGVTEWSQNRYLHQDVARDPEVVTALTPKQLAHPLRIGVSGEQPSYLFYGEQLKDDVNVLGHRGPHGEFDAPPSCRALLKDIRVNHDDVVILLDQPDGTVPPLNDWLSRDAHAKHVELTGGRDLYVMTARPSPAACSNPSSFKVSG